jgi:hypothetical protein
MTLRAGTAKVVITPPVGVELAGYSFGPSLGILNDLEAQALVLESRNESVAIVTADLLMFSSDFVAQVKRRVEAKLGIPIHHILLSASHTHSSPTAMALRQWGSIDETYLCTLEASLVGVITLAQRNSQEARLGLGLGRVENISENRRGIQEIFDPTVPLLRFDGITGQPIAVLFNFGCHPVSLHSYRNLVSPDYPGYARQVIQDVLGRDVIVMFTLGTAGDINPAGYVAGQTTPQRSRQIGAILGCEVAKIALDPLFQSDPVLRVTWTVLDLPVEPLPPTVELEEIRDHFATEAERLRAKGASWAEVSVCEIKRDWATDCLQAWERGQVQHAVPCEVLAIRLGDAALIAAPLEIFTKTGLAIKGESPAKVTLISSNSNGAVGYLPTQDAYQESDYTNPQGLAPKVYGLYALASGAESFFRQEAIRLLKELFR